MNRRVKEYIVYDQKNNELITVTNFGKLIMFRSKASVTVLENKSRGHFKRFMAGLEKNKLHVIGVV